MTYDQDPYAPEPDLSWNTTSVWAWAAAALVAGAVLLVAAGAVLAHADFGTTLRARGCDASPLGGLALLAVGSSLVVAGAALARLRVPGAVLVLDWGSLGVSAPVPAGLLALTLPGALGCRLGRDLARLDGIGDAVSGTSGLLLAAGSCALLGSALGAVVHVTWLTARTPSTGPLASSDVVELAMAEADALANDPAATRFHGVDDGS